MPRIDPNEVREIAQLARLRLDDAEIARLAGELDAVLTHIEELRQLDTEGIEPMTHAVPFACPLREDAVGAMLEPDQALANAPARDGGFFQVPRIVPGPGQGSEM
jgi:aspartyl-tRNA(Asn)/glutamyl-tRNA(Gln) amidotransferase subunit C